VVEYIPDKTNYTKYLKYFLFFIIMILIIIGLLFGGYLLLKNADKIKERLAELVPKRQVVNVVRDADDLSGRGLVDGQSVYG
jgi:hypothetical protein